MQAMLNLSPCGRSVRKRALCVTALTASLFSFAAIPEPCFAQVDLSGSWRPLFHEDQVDRQPGPDVGDYSGLPLNDAGRARADEWSGALIELPENQCRPHPADYAWRGPFYFRIWPDIDPYTQKLTAYHIHSRWEPDRTIWTDGRAPSSEYAPHSSQGISLGTWEGNNLRIVTDHLQEGEVRRNGVVRSDYAVVSQHMMRHGNYLTVAVITYDPVYLSEPLIRTTDYVLAPQQHVDPYVCETQTESPHPQGEIPHFDRGANPNLLEWAQRWGIPPEAVRGGAETMYPEYIAKMATMKRLPRTTKRIE